MKRILLLVPVMTYILIVILLGLTGCESTAPRPFPPPPSGEPYQESTPAPAPTPEPTPPAKLEKQWEIIDIAAKVTEKNPTWWKYSWKLVLRNNSSSPFVFDATIEFLDAEGFIVDDDRTYDLRVNQGEEKTFTGYALVTASVAPNIKSLQANIKKR